MRSPIDTRFQKVQELLVSGRMVGEDRPVGRLTWSHQRVTPIASTKKGVDLVRYIPKNPIEHEVGNIRSIDIDRSVGQDSATCTITMHNIRPDSTQPEGIDTASTVGYLTAGHGEPLPVKTSVYQDAMDPITMLPHAFPTDWRYVPNGYRDVFIPNTVLRTYQGYGSDNFDRYGNVLNVTDPGYVEPSDDSKLYLTGTWLIDKVTYGADGLMTVECRDLAKLLIEQAIYPPLIPMNRFPLIYIPAHGAAGKKEQIGKNVGVFHSSSVDAAHGANASILGHRGSHAFDTYSSTFWYSGGATSANNVEWLQAKTSGPVNEVVLFAYGANMTAYVSVHSGGKWQGTSVISGSTENLSFSDSSGSAEGGFFYVITSGDTLWDLAGTYYGDNTMWPIIARANNNIIKDPHWIFPGQKIKIPYVAGTLSPPPAGSGGTGGTHVSIPYVAKASVPASGQVTIHLSTTYPADYVRVTFSNLAKRANGDYRAGVRTMTCRFHQLNTYVASDIGKAGYIQDWSETIKELCAWAGLAWEDATPNPPDPVVGRTKSGLPLRVWGDFEILGAGPVVPTPADYFMSKSFMDGIRQVVDFIGGIFFIDESGGAQFRLPNIWTGGNFIDDTTAASTLGARIHGHPIEFHEDVNIVEYEAVISDQSVRSEILVIGGYPSKWSTGPIAGGYVLGYDPVAHATSAIDFTDILAGQYRLTVVPGESTKLFYSERECQRMAELTALFILFTYRQGTIKAPCHPALQLDDQVQIFERITYETNIHYVSAINSHQDLESGEYTMQVTTHWLGKDPDTDWFVNKAQLTPAVKSLPAILARVGREAGGDQFEQPPYGT